MLLVYFDLGSEECRQNSERISTQAHARVAHQGHLIKTSSTQRLTSHTLSEAQDQGLGATGTEHRDQLRAYHFHKNDVDKHHPLTHIVHITCGFLCAVTHIHTLWGCGAPPTHAAATGSKNSRRAPRTVSAAQEAHTSKLSCALPPFGLDMRTELSSCCVLTPAAGLQGCRKKGR